MIDRINTGFENIFSKKADVCCFAPGRVNLIGEHTDYNGGHVLPCAINFGIYCAAARRADRKMRFFSSNFSGAGIVEFELDSLGKTDCWADYPAGVMLALKAFGYFPDCGADFYFDGDLPNGSGLSSSAALETVTITAVKELFSFPLTAQETAVIGQFAENRFIGVNCGIMDQFASAMGKSGNAILLDSDTLSYSYVPVAGAEIVIVNSGVKHSLASSEYNRRRSECEHAAAAMQVKTLCSLTPEEYEKRKHLLDDEILIKRAKHAVYESQRTIDAAQALECNDIGRFGKLMNMSHISLRDDYEVSCAELDFLAETAWNTYGVFGARMTGGGFGGCTVNLVEKGKTDLFADRIRTEYKTEFDITPEVYQISIADGAGKR